MSLILAVPHDGAWLLMADSYEESGRLVMPEKVKLGTHGGWLVGHVGDTADQHAYLHGLPIDADLSDPYAHRERVKRAVAMQDEGEKYNAVFFFGRRGDLYLGNAAGYLWPLTGLDAAGTGQDLAHYLLKKHVLTGPREAILAAGRDILTEVEQTYSCVRLPMYWADSRERVVRRYEGAATSCASCAACGGPAQTQHIAGTTVDWTCKNCFAPICDACWHTPGHYHRAPDGWTCQP